MRANSDEAAVSRPPLKSDLINPEIVASDYNIPQTTQAIWRHENRYGWRDLVLKLGSSVRYRRSEVERWIEARRIHQTDGGGTS
jgi:hypothetical protein